MTEETKLTLGQMREKARSNKKTDLKVGQKVTVVWSGASNVGFTSTIEKIDCNPVFYLKDSQYRGGFALASSLYIHKEEENPKMPATTFKVGKRYRLNKPNYILNGKIYTCTMKKDGTYSLKKDVASFVSNVSRLQDVGTYGGANYDGVCHSISASDWEELVDHKVGDKFYIARSNTPKVPYRIVKDGNGYCLRRKTDISTQWGWQININDPANLSLREWDSFCTNTEKDVVPWKEPIKTITRRHGFAVGDRVKSTVSGSVGKITILEKTGAKFIREGDKIALFQFYRSLVHEPSIKDVGPKPDPIQIEIDQFVELKKEPMKAIQKFSLHDEVKHNRHKWTGTVIKLGNIGNTPKVKIKVAELMPDWFAQNELTLLSQENKFSVGDEVRHKTLSWTATIAIIHANGNMQVSKDDSNCGKWAAWYNPDSFELLSSKEETKKEANPVTKLHSNGVTFEIGDEIRHRICRTTGKITKIGPGVISWKTAGGVSFCSNADKLELLSVHKNKSSKSTEKVAKLAEFSIEKEAELMKETVAMAHNYVTSENLIRLEKVRNDLRTRTELNRAGLKALKDGIKQPYEPAEKPKKDEGNTGLVFLLFFLMGLTGVFIGTLI